MLTRSKAQKRNREIIQLYNLNPNMSAAEIGRKFDLSRQRISSILRKYKAIRICENCYHFQEYQHCSCRSLQDICKVKNKCSDWEPVTK
jgi:predicted DNA-binding protein YlxM (UPF0122 family)